MRMVGITIAIIIVLVALATFFAYLYYFHKAGTSPVNQVCFSNSCFSVELAATESQRERGLMNRISLDQNKGMLFIFDQPGSYSFWMKNTLIPLDMVWIGQDHKITFIEHSAQPCSGDVCPPIVPKVNALYVLEVNAGAADKLGLKVGDMVTLKP